MYSSSRDNSHRTANPSSLFLPLDATISTSTRPRKRHGRDDAGSSLTGEDTLRENSDEENNNQDAREEEKIEETFMSIGVDFGTTYSGVAWSLSTSPKEITIVSDWDTKEANNIDLEKVPSVVTYNDRDRGIVSWGFTLEEKEHHISWFKMGLCDEADRMLAKEQPERYKKLYRLLEKYNKTPLDVSAEYLRKLWKHAMRSIEEMIDPALWEIITLRIILTVPAIWDHKAQELTRQAAKRAGMLDRKGSTLELIGEPEAAALAIFSTLNTSRNQTSLQPGDSFVICDAGGGTVDLISYRLEQLDPVILTMCAEATGGCCGAIFLDGAFENQMRTLITEKGYNNLRALAKRRMMHEWEFGLKRNFRKDVPDDETFHIHIPGFRGPLAKQAQQTPCTSELSGLSDLSITSSLHYDFSDGILTLGPGHVKAMFDKVCSKIVDLIRDQLKVVEEQDGNKPAYIFPVGGFGGNRYLKEHVKQTFKDLSVRVSTRPWSAICRGAVLKGLGHDLVVNHVPKYNYGIICDYPFLEGKHLPEDRVFRELPHVWMAQNQTEWFLKKGDNVLKGTPIRHNYHFSITKPSDLNRLSLQIYYSDSTEPETRLTPSVKTLCKLDMRFSPSIFDKLTLKINEKGVKWRVLGFVLEMQVSSGQLNWTAKHNGIEGGKISTRVEYERERVIRSRKQDIR